MKLRYRASLVVGLFILVTSSGGLSAWDWPLVPDGKLGESVSFGSLQSGSLEPGLVFEDTEGKTVRAAETGEIIFFSSGLGRRRSRVFQNPEGSLVLAHQNGLRSSYGGMKSLVLPGDDSYLAGNRLTFLSTLSSRELQELKMRWTPASPGNLGVAGQKFFFTMNDPAENTVVNPWAFLPLDMEREVPRFVSFRLGVVGTDQVIPGFSWMEVPWKEVEFQVIVKDPWASLVPDTMILPQGKTRMPHGSTLKKLELKRDGLVLASLDMRLLTAVAKSGRRKAINEAHVLAEQSRLAANTYSLGMIKLKEGDNSLDLVIYDMAGKRKIYDLWVRVKVPASIPAP